MRNWAKELEEGGISVNMTRDKVIGKEEEWIYKEETGQMRYERTGRKDSKNEEGKQQEKMIMDLLQ